MHVCDGQRYSVKPCSHSKRRGNLILVATKRLLRLQDGCKFNLTFSPSQRDVSSETKKSALCRLLVHVRSGLV